MGRLAAFTCALILTCLGALPGHAEKRVALVIGNSKYQYTPPLKNPANDASDMADALERLGFDVVRGLDLDYAGLRQRVRSFTEKLTGADVALFFYAGHGLQIGGKNYLAPIDARIESEADLDFATVDLDLVVRNMEREQRTNIVFLDACRDNPMTSNLARKMGTRSVAVGRGLARVESGIGTLIAFATQPGNTALDGDGRNSPFTAALLGTIERPGLSIGEVMISVRNAVLKETDGKQVPWEHSSLTGQFYFAPVALPPAGASGTPDAARIDPASVEFAFWDTIKGSNNPRLFEAYLKRYPAGTFADIAKIRIDELKVASLKPAAGQPDERTVISDPGLLHEVRDRLYELNFDPGALDGPLNESARQAIREFEAGAQLPQTGEATQGLLRRLRGVGGLKPWGAIVYAPGEEKWGMSWAGGSRKEAVASARATCGDAGKCSTEISFFGTECGAFAYSRGVWSIVARDSIAQAKETALTDCRKRGKACQIVGAVCADGAGRSSAN
ncbi:MAG: caspase family protein [Xanthobacteraceae bacterium]